MSHLRALRLNRALTYLDLAALTGIPARALAEAELGLRGLSPYECAQLALVFGVADEGQWSKAPAAPHRSRQNRPRPFQPPRRPQAALAQAPWSITATLPPAALPGLLALALAGSIAAANLQGLPSIRLPSIRLPALEQPVLLAPERPTNSPPGPTEATTAAAAGHALHTALDLLHDYSAQRHGQATLRAILDKAAHEPISPALLLAPPPPQAIPLPAGRPRFRLSERGPLGCPVQPTSGKVVMTQGYGVGTHAPAAIWGAVDLAIDGNGDGLAEPGPSWYAPVVATLDGLVTVTLNSYPAGNHVWVRSRNSPWRTGYSHLALVTVISGQIVRAGDVIGMIGSSGESSGPHLDYQVWYGEQNIDPTELVMGSCTTP